jgi:hypothetical protein
LAGALGFDASLMSVSVGNAFFFFFWIIVIVRAQTRWLFHHFVYHRPWSPSAPLSSRAGRDRVIA